MNTFNTPSPYETWRRCLDSSWGARPEIVLFGLFAIPVCAADMWLTFVGPQTIKAATVAFTGWNASMPYLFGLAFAFSLVFGRDHNFRLRLGIVGPLLVYVVFGVIEYALPRGQDFGNPYLQVSPWRPVWTVALPAIWSIVLLLAPIFRGRRDRIVRQLRPFPQG